MGSKRTEKRAVLLLLNSCLVLAAGPARAQDDSYGGTLYQQRCAACHGRELTGGNAQSLVDGLWQFGGDRGSMFRNIKFGISARGMPEFQHSLNDRQIHETITFILDSQDRSASSARPCPIGWRRGTTTSSLRRGSPKVWRRRGRWCSSTRRRRS